MKKIVSITLTLLSILAYSANAANDEKEISSVSSSRTSSTPFQEVLFEDLGPDTKSPRLSEDGLVLTYVKVPPSGFFSWMNFFC